ncbi:MAG: hypothetical protein JOZ47_22385 [Kutzneria sp.]|nr:hypothetical protein [Kutzneria sp.]MBV9847797.1 hypothetical protein [Kutzneria sp.]
MSSVKPVSSVKHGPAAGSRLLALVLGVSAALAVAGCSAGQITQTDDQVAAVNGASGTSGPISVRDVRLAFPTADGQYYSRGADVPLIVTIVNSGQTTDTLSGVSSPAFRSATITGTTEIVGQNAVSPASAAPAPTSTSSPTATGSATATVTPSSQTTVTRSTSALPFGQIRIVLTGLTLERLAPGQTVEVRFTFGTAGDITLRVPIGAPSGSRDDRS